MQLNDLKSAWQQYKLQHALHPVDSGEVLSILDAYENPSKARLQRIVFSVVMFIVVAIFCQGG
jgi:hypothetical protein